MSAGDWFTQCASELLAGQPRDGSILAGEAISGYRGVSPQSLWGFQTPSSLGHPSHKAELGLQSVLREDGFQERFDPAL